MSFSSRILIEEAGITIGQRLSNAGPASPRIRTPRPQPSQAAPVITQRRVAPGPITVPAAPSGGSFGTRMGRSVGNTLRDVGILERSPKQTVIHNHQVANKDLQNDVDRMQNDDRKRIAGRQVRADARKRQASQTSQQPLIDAANQMRQDMSAEKWAGRKQATKDFTNNHLIPGAKLAGMSLGMGAKDLATTVGQGINLTGQGIKEAGKAYLKHMPTKKW